MYNGVKRMACLTVRVIAIIVMVICITCILISRYINGSANDSKNSFSVSTLVKLQKYLICDGELDVDEVIYYDVDNNGILNAIDVVLIKQSLIAQSGNVEEGATTTTVQTTTTTAVETSVTTTSISIDFTPPTQDDIISPEGFSPSDEEYEGLIESAELFGLDYYKIIWTDELIPYSLVIPSDSYSGINNIEGYPCYQVCPVEDIEKIRPNYDWKVTGFDLMVWKPNSDGTISCRPCSQELYWDQQYGFVIIPMTVNEEGELVEDLRLLYPTSE